MVANHATGAGGGIETHDSIGLVISNSTISGNTADGDGAGVYTDGTSMDISFSTIANNQAVGAGGAIWATTLFNMKNTIVGNNAGTGSQCDGTAAVNSLGYNLDEDGSCAGAGTGDLSGVNPLLGPLQDNGGTLTHALLPGSPAIDSADPFCNLIDGTVATDDQRLVPRPLDGDAIPGALCDRGAFEAPTFVPPIPPPVPNGIFGVSMKARRGDPAGTTFDVQWDTSLCTSNDFHLIAGNLASVSSLTPTGSACDLGNSGTALGITAPPVSFWFLIVADDDGLIEGSWGEGTSGTRQGTTPSFQCGITVRDNAGTCP